MSSSNSTAAVPSSADHPNSVLRRVFAVDRVVCAVSAVTLVAASPLLADLLDWPTATVAMIGVALAPYAYLLHKIHHSGRLRSGLAKLTAVGDAGWVIASVALIVGWPDATSTGGKWLIAAIAVVIGEIGLTKVYGWSKADTFKPVQPRAAASPPKS